VITSKVELKALGSKPVAYLTAAHAHHSVTEFDARLDALTRKQSNLPISSVGEFPST
jgi:hypothetical protein